SKFATILVMTLAFVCIPALVNTPHADASPNVGCVSLSEIGGASCAAVVPGESSGVPSGGQQPAAPGGSGGQPAVPDPCTYTQIDVANSLISAARVSSEVNETTLTTGTWYERDCDDGSVNMVNWAPPGGAAPEVVLPSPQVLAQQAVTSVTVTTPQISL